MARRTNMKIMYTLLLALLLLPCCGDDSGEIEITYTADLVATPSECTELCLCILCDHELFEVEREYAYLYIYYEIECINGGFFVLTGPNGEELWRLWVPWGEQQGSVEIPFPEIGRYHFHGPLTFLGGRRVVYIYGL